MNDNNLINNSDSTTRYKATRNLNTEIENPEININSAVGVNIKDISPNNIPNNDNINNYFNDNLNNNLNIQNENNYGNTSQVLPNNINQNSFINPNNNYSTMGNQNTSYDNNINQTTPNYNELNKSTGYVATITNEEYKPTMQEKKKHQSFKVPTELKVMILIVLILLIFIFVIPDIYEFIKGIELTLTR